MGIKTYKPITPGLRQRSVLDFEEITQSKPEKSLLRPLRKTGLIKIASRDFIL